MFFHTSEITRHEGQLRSALYFSPAIIRSDVCPLGAGLVLVLCDHVDRSTATVEPSTLRISPCETTNEIVQNVIET